MEKVGLELIAWGKDHWWFFGWTLFWSSLMAMGIGYGLVQGTYFTLRRVIRGLVVLVRGWPPAHLDADGDWKPRQKVVKKVVNKGDEDGEKRKLHSDLHR